MSCAWKFCIFGFFIHFPHCLWPPTNSFCFYKELIFYSLIPHILEFIQCVSFSDSFYLAWCPSGYPCCCKWQDVLSRGWVVFLSVCIRHLGSYLQSVMSSFLKPHGLQHARLPYPSPTPGACSNSCPLSWWCHPTLSSSYVPLLLPPSVFPSIRVFPNESALCISWLNY